MDAKIVNPVSSIKLGKVMQNKSVCKRKKLLHAVQTPITRPFNKLISIKN